MATRHVSHGNGDPQWAPTAFVGLIGVLIFVLCFIGLIAYFRTADTDERYVKVITQTPEDLVRLRTEQLEQIEGYRWRDPEKGIVTIPIDRAMEIVAGELKGRK